MSDRNPIYSAEQVEEMRRYNATLKPAGKRERPRPARNAPPRGVNRGIGFGIASSRPPPRPIGEQPRHSPTNQSSNNYTVARQSHSASAKNFIGGWGSVATQPGPFNAAQFVNGSNLATNQPQPQSATTQPYLSGGGFVAGRPEPVSGLSLLIDQAQPTATQSTDKSPFVGLAGPSRASQFSAALGQSVSDFRDKRDLDSNSGRIASSGFSHLAALTTGASAQKTPASPPLRSLDSFPALQPVKTLSNSMWAPKNQTSQVWQPAGVFTSTSAADRRKSSSQLAGYGAVREPGRLTPPFFDEMSDSGVIRPANQQKSCSPAAMFHSRGISGGEDRGLNRATNGFAAPAPTTPAKSNAAQPLFNPFANPPSGGRERIISTTTEHIIGSDTPSYLMQPSAEKAMKEISLMAGIPTYETTPSKEAANYQKGLDSLSSKTNPLASVPLSSTQKFNALAPPTLDGFANMNLGIGGGSHPLASGDVNRPADISPFASLIAGLHTQIIAEAKGMTGISNGRTIPATSWFEDKMEILITVQ